MSMSEKECEKLIEKYEILFPSLQCFISKSRIKKEVTPDWSGLHYSWSDSKFKSPGDPNEQQKLCL